MQRLVRYGVTALLYILVGLASQGCGRGLRLLPDELMEPVRPPDLAARPEPAWKTRLPTPPTALLPVGQRVLLITTHRGEVYRLNLETGKRDGPIRQPLRKAITAQLVHGEGPYLYIASARDAELRAYLLTRGKTSWKRKASGISGQLAVTGGLLLTAGVTGEVAAYDTSDGHLVWRRRLPGRIYRGVWVLDTLALVLNDAGTLYAFAPRQETAQGHIPTESHPYLWRRELPVSPNAVVAAGAGRLVLGDANGRLLEIDPASGETVFQTRLGAPIYSQPLVADSLVVAATAAGEIIALRGSDGTPVWRVKAEGLVKHPLLAAGGPTPQVLLVVFARGRLLALELASGRELWRYDLEQPIELVSLTPDGIVIADRRNNLLYLRAADSATPAVK